VYKGGRANGKRNGKGVNIYMHSRETYNGEWLNDKRSG